MIVETTKLINAIKKMYPVAQFFKDRYFPDGKVFYSEKALIETKKGNRKVAPFVVPVVGGIVMDAEGYRAEAVKAPYIAPKMPITADELEKKAFGESPESGRTPAQRENEIEAEHMDDMRKAILRRHELMCTEIITTGACEMKHYSSADDAANDTNYKTMLLQFYDTAFGNKWTLSKAWSTMTAKEKLQEFYKVAEELKKRGVSATDIVMTADVSMDLMTDKDFLDYYDKSRVEFGNINQSELPDGVTNNGTININGILFTMFTYSEQYEDMDGTVKPMLPRGTVAFLRPGLGTTVYSQVTFVKGGAFNSYADKMIPRVVSSESNNMIEVQMFSRPVPYPLDVEGWLIFNIYDEIPSTLALTSGVDIKTEDEINRLNSKAAVIAYAQSIGLTLTDDKTLADLKTAVIEYQDEKFGE